MSKASEKILLVEDNDHSAVVVGLMNHHRNLGDKASGYAVEIRVMNSAEEVLERTSLETYSKASNLRALGVIVDADDVIGSRWSRIRSFAESISTAVPIALPNKGLVVVNAERGIKFGAWVMPDNISAGKVETFCCSLLRQESQDLWTHAKVACEDARNNHGALWRDAHRDRANIFTWLAWQDPPLGQMGAALRGNYFNPNAPSAIGFVDWMKELYDL